MTSPVTPTNPAPATTAPSKRRWFRRRGVLVPLVVLLAVALAGLIDGLVILRGVDRVDLELPGAGPGATDFLLLVTDGDDGAGSATVADLVAVLHLPEDPDAAQLLAVPRDLLVGSGGSSTIGALLSDGVQAVVDATCDSLGIGADHVVAIDLAAFGRMVDRVGGVEVVLPRSLRDRNGAFAADAGAVTFGGTDVAALLGSAGAVEERIGGQWRPMTEATRSALGALVLKRLGRELTSVRNPWTLRSLARTVSGAALIDSGFRLRDGWQLRSTLRAVADSRLPVDELPTRVASGAGGEELAPAAAAVLASAGAGANDACPAPVLNGRS